MEGARAGRTAGLARDVLERARRRRRRPAGRLPASGPVSAEGPAGWIPASGPEEDSERLSAAFASIVNLMNQATRECEKYYSFMAACRCKEHEIKHICRYHGRQAGERELESSEEEGPEASVAPSQARTCQRHSRQASEDIYIEVSPGTYSVTATSEDMVQQTHVVDVNAGQSIDLTFVL